MADGSSVCVTVIVAQTGVTVYERVPEQPALSKARTVNVDAVLLVGVPVMAPVVVFNDRPAGRDPPVTANV